MSSFDPFAYDLSLKRRAFLQQSAYGLGGMAFASLLSKADAAASSSERWQGVIRKPHAPVKARRVIHLCMAGGPSHLETFDWKPELKRLDGQAFPESFTKGQQLAQLQGAELKARGPITTFTKHGQTGNEISDLFPHMAGIADDLCIIRSMQTEQINHDTAHAFMNTGSIIKGRPSMGSWLLYGLGCETEELPGFVVLTSQGKTGQQPISARQWSSGILPSKFQGIMFNSKGDAVHYLGSPEGVCQSTQRQIVEEVKRLNGILAEDRVDPEIQTRIAQYEMAFKMQTSVPELTDMSRESKETLEMYGVKEPGDGTFASNCLLARRMAERGVRMIQLYHRAWDHHGGIEEGMKSAAQDVDKASAALIKDLKQRGLLDDTLILWGGEFGRTPMGQGTGRDHHILAFNVALAGGGVKPGTYGATDELGYRAVENVVHVHDLHATMLHLLGIDHKRMTVKFQGLDVRLTGIAGHLVKGIVA
ncbi:sulfatase [Verrucomicrobiaceae bacterium SCGC AG-212-N21]|nr:sulfatase [Verrucomicrobiaceae bacterium SCGC AG-212-N21]